MEGYSHLNQKCINIDENNNKKRMKNGKMVGKCIKWVLKICQFRHLSGSNPQKGYVVLIYISSHEGLSSPFNI